MNRWSINRRNFNKILVAAWGADLTALNTGDNGEVATSII